MNTMTLEQFRATGRDVADLQTVDPNAFDAPSPGRVYAGDLYIEYAGGEGAFLTLGNEQLVGTLEELEAELYDFGVREGIL